ncbi:MAG TPA: hypothetical protein VIY96_00060, partial [Thermoanaerobaculia bacterium]
VGGAPPPVATLNYTGSPGELRNNAAIVPVDQTTGAFIIGAGVSGTDYVLDANGIFLFELEDNTSFVVRSTVDDAAIIGRNTSIAPNAVGVRGEITSLTAGASSTAVRGANSSTTGLGIGVWGSQNGSGWGVNGSSVNGIGVRGINTASSGATNAIWGINNSGSNDSAGVFGTANVDSNPVVTPAHGYAGVRGESSVFGVLGLAELGGVRGVLVDSAGGLLAAGTIGSSQGTDAGGVAPWSFFGFVGDLGNVGAKSFVEPHPHDASKIIQYTSLEGPEAGTYFRGRARFENGLARIPVPDHFRMVTDPEGLTVQITPIGEMASVAVLRMDLNEVVVQSSRNVEFSYLVQGIRASQKNRPVIVTSSALTPESANAKMPVGWPDLIKRHMIENGTYKEDGTVNLETAHRLGWEKIWEKLGTDKPVKKPTPESQSPE